jgi:hypothetical protein
MVRNIQPHRVERLRRIDLMLATGGHTFQEMAEKEQVDVATIVTDVEFIRTNWWVDRETKRTEQTRAERLRELEYLKRLSLESFTISRKIETTQDTSFIDVPCPECEGTGNGTGKGGICIGCEGKKFETVERTITKTEGKPGDVAFLNTALSIVKEMCRLEALYKETIHLHRHQLHGDVNVNHDINRPTVDYSDADPELLLQLMDVQTKIEYSVQEKRRLEVAADDAARVLDVRSFKAAAPPNPDAPEAAE